MVAPNTLVPGADSRCWSTGVCLCLEGPRGVRRSRDRLVRARLGPAVGTRRLGPPLPPLSPDWPDWAPAPPTWRPPRAAG